jgi:uncharacterized protein YdaU (DUF1376 family)
MEFYHRYPALALSGMAELTLEQCGAYNRLIDLLYDRDGLIADDDYLVARMMHIDVRVWRRVKKQLQLRGKIWVNDDGFLRVPRFDKTVISARSRSTSAELQANFRWDLSRKASDFNEPPHATKRKRKIDKVVSTPHAEPVDGAHTLPPTWQPNSNHLMIADQIGLTQSEVVEAAAQMRAWAWGNGRSRSNWDFFFESWIRRRKPKGTNGNGRYVEKSKSLTDAAQRMLDQLRSGTRNDPSADPVRLLPQERHK